MTIPNGDSDPEIILIEDNKAEADLLIHCMRKEGMSGGLLHFDDGQKALEWIMADRPHRRPRLIILDINMPRLNGIEILHRIRQNPISRTLPVVMLTSSKEPRDIQASYDLGTNAYVVKPINFDDFAVAVRQLGVFWGNLNQPPAA